MPQRMYSSAMTSTSTRSSRERVLTALRCQEPDRVPFLESVVDEPVTLALLGKPRPEHLVMGELGTGQEPVFRGTLLGSPRYEPIELVHTLGLDSFGMYLFLRHEGVQKQVNGLPWSLAGGSRRASGEKDVSRISQGSISLIIGRILSIGQDDRPGAVDSGHEFAGDRAGSNEISPSPSCIQSPSRGTFASSGPPHLTHTSSQAPERCLARDLKRFSSRYQAQLLVVGWCH